MSVTEYFRNSSASPGMMGMAVLACMVASTLLLVVYRFTLHPLAKFPGPWLAHISKAWLFFEEMGGYGHEHILELHEKYGSVIRIAPNELSFNDLHALEDIYAQRSRIFPKAPYFFNAFDNPHASLFSTTDTKRHARDKRLMSYAFSRANLLNFQGVIYDHIDMLHTWLRQYCLDGASIPLWYATQCFTLDTVSKLSYGTREGALDQADFIHPLWYPFETFPKFTTFFQYFPVFRYLFMAFMGLTSAGASGIQKGSREGYAKVRDVKEQSQAEGGIIMFASMLERAKNLGVRLTEDELVAHGGTMLLAGTGTTGAAMTAALYHLASDPGMWKQLQATLRAESPKNNPRPNVADLERVPLLDACIKEALRIAFPVAGRQPRVVPEGGWDYNGHHIAEGTFVSCAMMYFLRDRQVFPEPEKFKPERWLEGATPEMHAYMIPFNRGVRSCIGQNLALMELHIGISQIVMHYDPVEVLDKELHYFEYSISSPETKVPVKLAISEW